jgi:hypothetical protein
MRRRFLIAVVALGLSLAAGRVEAVTVRDVIELSKAGLSDSVLLALIDVDRSVYSIDTATLKQLKTAGVSDAVIVAMIRSGREPRAEETAQPVMQPQPEPQPEPQDSTQPAAVPAPAAPYPVAIPIPVYVAVPFVTTMSSHDGRRPSLKPVVVQPELPPNCVAAQVPRWGFGGTIRQPPPPCR